MEVSQRRAEGQSPEASGAARQANELSPAIDELDLKLKVAEVLARWPSAGLAVAVVRDGSPEWFFGHGVADVASREPITE
jgi:CubicO group peptidase (beta-lactamase class C family)